MPAVSAEEWAKAWDDVFEARNRREPIRRILIAVGYIPMKKPLGMWKHNKSGDLCSLEHALEDAAHCVEELVGK